MGRPFLKGLKASIEAPDIKRVLWFTTPTLPFMLSVAKWDAIVYDCSDLWAAPLGLASEGSLRKRTAKKLIFRLENRIIRSSEVLFASSGYLSQQIAARSGREAKMIENGVELQMFLDGEANSARTSLSSIPRPRLGFVGGMKNKIDFALLERVAEEKPGWSLVLIGPGILIERDDFNRLLRHDNVHWIEKIRPEEVPAYLRGLDVGLMPYREIEYNKAVFPLKLFEYLAAGLPVVGCGVPETGRYSAEGVYLHVARAGFIGACEAALAWTGIDDEAFRKSRKELAARADWEKKFDCMYREVTRSMQSKPS